MRDVDLPIYRPRPVPATASDIARRIVAIANLVPAGRWTTYGDLAEAAGSSSRGVASALSAVTPLDSAGIGPAADVEGWVVPWRRIRMGDGRVKSRAAESNIRERQALENSMYVAEGGRLMANNAAPSSQRFLLAAELRRRRDRGERTP